MLSLPARMAANNALVWGSSRSAKNCAGGQLGLVETGLAVGLGQLRLGDLRAAAHMKPSATSPISRR